MAHLLVVGGLASSLVRFRGPLIDAALAAGHTVSTAAGEPDAETRAALARRGVTLHELGLDRTGTNPLDDLRVLHQLEIVLDTVRPDVILGYTLKPAIYSVMASRRTGIGRPFAMLTGLGAALSAQAAPWRPATLAARALSRHALPQAEHLFFHNPDDRRTAIGMRIAIEARSSVVAGSGVDLEAFPFAAWQPGPMTFLFVGRLLRDKGIREFVEAASAVHAEFPEVRFRAVGGFDANPHSLAPEDVEQWQRTTPVDFVGPVAQPWAEFAGCHAFVLPSYAEGLPRTALEAMAVGRAVITTDVPGCRETVRDGNGILVPPRDACSLAAAMRRCIEDRAECRAMGERGRRLAESVFDARVVAAEMLRRMELMTGTITTRAA